VMPIQKTLLDIQAHLGVQEVSLPSSKEVLQLRSSGGAVTELSEASVGAENRQSVDPAHNEQIPQNDRDGPKPRSQSISRASSPVPSLASSCTSPVSSPQPVTPGTHVHSHTKRTTLNPEAPEFFVHPGTLSSLNQHPPSWQPTASRHPMAPSPYHSITQSMTGHFDPSQAGWLGPYGYYDQYDTFAPLPATVTQASPGQYYNSYARSPFIYPHYYGTFYSRITAPECTNGGTDSGYSSLVNSANSSPAHSPRNSSYTYPTSTQRPSFGAVTFYPGTKHSGGQY